jgi:adenylate cyclase
LPAEEARLASVRNVDPAAYEAYLKGSQSRLALTEGGLETAERYFTLALQIDPDYAAAWAGIARVWNGRGQMGITPQREAMRRSKEAVLRALALDETEYEAHRALAGILTWGEWDWPAAERQWKRNLAVNPNDGEALAGYSHFLMNMGRPEEAMAQVERARELDPFNVKLRSFYVTDLVYVRRYDDAIAEAREVLRLQPDAPVARDGLYHALHLKGMFDEALALDRARFAGDRERTEALERGYAEGGYAGAQRRIADLLASRYGPPGGPAAYRIALRYLYAGDHDRTLEWLERAYQDGDGNMPYLGLPIYDSLRADGRFQDLLRRMNLPRGTA